MGMSINGTLLRQQEEGSRFYKADESQKYYAEWKKPDAKGHLLYDPFYMKYSDEVNPERESGGCQAPGGGKDEEWLV